MRTRYGTPPWGLDVPASRVPSFPRFRGDQTADVVIIGAGLTGSVAAYLCATSGLRTVLLEADRIGMGQTSRSAGVMSPEPGPLFRAVAAQHGLRAARLIFETWRKGALDGAALLRRLRVKCHLQPRETLIAVAAHNERELRREHDARRDARLDVAWLTPKQMQSRVKLDAAGGLKTRDGFALDPYRACLGIIAAARTARAECHERSRVKKVRFTRKFAEVLAEGGTIRTAKVIVATGNVTEVYKPLQRHLDAREAYMVLTDRMPAAMRKALGDPRIVLRDPEEPSTQISAVDGDRLLISGADQGATPPKKRGAVLIQRTGALMYEVLKRYPAISGLQPERGWEAPYGRTADGLMYIGAHRNYPHHLFAVGGSADSVTGSFVAGRMLLRAVQDASEKSDEALGWTR
jgi:glycine/D-amino acid oxidase-like deaminating enzyme